MQFCGPKKGLRSKISQTLVLNGGAEGDRTPDPLNAIQASSQWYNLATLWLQF